MIDHLLGYIDDEVLSKALRFCAYSERCQQDVRQKLYELKVSRTDSENIIAYLIRENFVNEERFAILFAGGKFRIKKWGRIKIKYALKQKNISSYCITKALNEISKSDYRKTLQQLIDAQNRKVKESNPLRKNHLISQALMAKGYEPELIWELLKDN